MRLAILSFVVGVALLQQQARLLAWQHLILLALAALCACLLTHRLQLSHRTNKWASVAQIGIKISASAALGFVWASAFSQVYLSQTLAPEWEQRDIRIIGVVDGLPHTTEQGTRFNFAVENVLADPDNSTLTPRVPSKIALSWYASPHQPDAIIGDIQPGQRWRLTVRLKRPHGTANPYVFDYEAWLLEQGLRATGSVRSSSKIDDATTSTTGQNEKLKNFVWSVDNAIERCRAVLRERINRALPGQPYAGVIVALVVGDQRDIAQSDWKIFNRTGIGHLVSISGLHITMIAGLFAALINFLWRRSFYYWNDLPLFVPAHKAAAISGAFMALIYVALAGFGLPAQRTLYMLSVVALAMWTDRLTSISHVLCLALGVVCLLDPWAVLSPGFWLSFSAVAMILFVSTGRPELPPAEHRRESWLRDLASGSRVQYAVTLGLLPLTMLLFGQVSFISPVANAIAIPLISFIVTPLSLIGSILPAPLADWVLQLAHICVAGLAGLLTYLSQLSVGDFSLAVWSAPLPEGWMFTLAMVGTLWLLAPRGIPLRWLGVVCWLPIVLQQTSHPASGTMTVIAFDVGQGMALLIETPTHRLLYDTGPSYSPESDGGNRVLLPYLTARGIRHLDHLVISHNDADHSGGALTLFKGIQIDRVSSSLEYDSPIVAAAPNHLRCMAGQQWDWDGIHFEMLYPVPEIYASKKWRPNARSCTLKITQGTHTILLAGDIEAQQEDELVNAIPAQLHADVLLAPHHGSGTSSTPQFLNAVHPSLAIFQVGYLNRYHHPKPEIFARYAELGITRVRTDEAGAITLHFGKAITFSDYRHEHARYWYQR